MGLAAEFSERRQRWRGRGKIHYTGGVTMNKLPGRAGAAMLLIAGLSFAAATQADTSLKCTMHFTMKGWSAFYKTSSGHGTVSCNDGSSIEVALSSKGGGLTLGKSSIDNGYGEFTGANLRRVRNGHGRKICGFDAELG